MDKESKYKIFFCLITNKKLWKKVNIKKGKTKQTKKKLSFLLFKNQRNEI